MCDRLLILAPGGRLAYFGPPQQALSLLQLQRLRRPVHPARTRHHHRLDRPVQHVTASSSPDRATRRPSKQRKPPATPAAKPVAQQSAFAQFTTLCRRYLAVIAADRQYSVTLLVLPLLLSLFAHAVPGKAGLSLTKAIETKSTQPSSIAGVADHRWRADGLRRLDPRNRQGTGHLSTRTRHRLVTRRLSGLQVGGPDRVDQLCKG